MNNVIFESDKLAVYAVGPNPFGIYKAEHYKQINAWFAIHASGYYFEIDAETMTALLRFTV